MFTRPMSLAAETDPAAIDASSRRAWAFATARPGRSAAAVLMGLAAFLAAWTVWLGFTLPATANEFAWNDGELVVQLGRTGWLTLDALETIGLIATGVAVLQRRRIAISLALLTAFLFQADMWFDAVSATSRIEVHEAMLMATFGEFPTSVLLIGMAVAAAVLWRSPTRASAAVLPGE